MPHQWRQLSEHPITKAGKVLTSEMEPLEVEIERILPGGVGLAHADGKTIFVALAAPGDQLRIRIDRQQGNVFFASIEEILNASPARVLPPCPYFGRCGGCDFQQLTYSAQLAAKSEIIRDCLRRIARIEDIPSFEVRPSPKEWNYRGRATWQIDKVEKAVGYYERASRRVCDVDYCGVLSTELQATLSEVRRASWDEFPDELKHLDAAASLEDASLSPEFSRFENKELSLKVGNEEYKYDASAFFQVNQSLVAELVDYAVTSRTGDQALDLYCGVGLFTLPLARRFSRVIGVEASRVAVRFARRNLIGAENVVISEAAVADWMKFERAKFKEVDFVLLDPPRAGAESAVIRGITELKPGRITYVSCDPATLARDLKKLMAQNYVLDALMGFDMFPQTHHVETVVHLRLER